MSRSKRNLICACGARRSFRGRCRFACTAVRRGILGAPRAEQCLARPRLAVHAHHKRMQPISTAALHSALVRPPARPPLTTCTPACWLCKLSSFLYFTHASNVLFSSHLRSHAVSGRAAIEAEAGWVRWQRIERQKCMDRTHDIPTVLLVVCLGKREKKGTSVWGVELCVGGRRGHAPDATSAITRRLAPHSLPRCHVPVSARCAQSLCSPFT